jgi:hypothetical protein
MKINEVIVEGRDGKITDLAPDHASTSTGIERVRDVGGYDRIYHMNRMMMAMAMADGKSVKAVDMPQSSWYEKYNTIHPYTDEEYKMYKSATKTIDSESQEVVPKSKSKEPNDVNKVSPHHNPGPIKRKKSKK